MPDGQVEPKVLSLLLKLPIEAQLQVPAQTAITAAPMKETFTAAPLKEHLISFKKVRSGVPLGLFPGRLAPRGSRATVNNFEGSECPSQRSDVHLRGLRHDGIKQWASLSR